MNAIYIFGDAEYLEMIKIGYDGNWPAKTEQVKKTTRFEQARSHNPRGVIVHGIWTFNSKDEMKESERKIHSLLRKYRRTDTYGREWFDIRYKDAERMIVSSGIVNSEAVQDPAPRTMSRDLPYDDWRDPSDVYKDQVYKRMLWVFQEDSLQKRLKVIHSPLFDTCYKYAFTYNPFPVHLVAAYHDSYFPTGPTAKLREGNLRVQSCWQAIVSDKEHGPGIMATNVGWLNIGATVEWVAEQALKCGLKPYDLLQPKPGCVRPQDPQITTIPAGGNWLKRVRQK